MESLKIIRFLHLTGAVRGGRGATHWLSLPQGKFNPLPMRFRRVESATRSRLGGLSEDARARL